MAPHKTITVNGREYDSVTGLPIDSSVKAIPPAEKPKTAAKATSVAKTTPTATKTAAKPVLKPKPAVAKKEPTTPRMQKAAGAVHGGPQRSQTLNRRATKKPVPTPRPVTKRPTPGKHMDIARSSSVARFATTAATATSTPLTTKKPEAPRSTVAAPSVVKKTTTKAAPRKLQKETAAKIAAVKSGAPIKADAPAKSHPAMQRALSRSSVKKATPKTATKNPLKPTTKQVKDQAINKALATPAKKQVAPKRRGKQNKSLRKALLIVGIAVAIVFALVAAYRFIPNISVSIASKQAGIEASYPEFTPDGYSLTKPVTYSDGTVALNFHSNSNKNSYTITQTRSSWDSSAVLDKVVTPEVENDYVTTKERGLTIYTFKSKAVWVNGGILYTIESSAELSGDQIRRIATSL